MGETLKNEHEKPTFHVDIVLLNSLLVSLVWSGK